MQWKVGKRLGVVIAGVALAFAAIGGVGLAAVVSKPSTTAGAQSTSTTSTTGDVKKTTICHKGKVTLRISVNAVAAHQTHHGDTLGACAGSAVAKKGKPDKAGKGPKADDESDDDD